MRKVVYTLCVDNYFPELSALTLPNHAAYAARIGAEFIILNERKYPEWHPTYEKVQIHALGSHNDWNIHIDADMLISDSLWDVTERLNPFTIGHYSIYDPRFYFKADEYFLRDGRLIGICSAFMAVPKACHDLWTPFDIPYEKALEGINKPHGIDDYRFSQNFARYGLKGDFFLGPDDDPTLYLEHLGVGGAVNDENRAKVIQQAHEVLKRWGQ